MTIPPAHRLTPHQTAAVEAVISRDEGRDVTLLAVTPTRPDDPTVLRVTDGDGRCWVVKRSRLAAGDPNLYRPWGFFAEWAGSEMASRAADVAARFLGGDADALVLVFEDLGTGADCSEVLRGSDPAVATRTLAEIGTALGRLHAATVDREDEFRSVWAGLCGDRPPPGFDQSGGGGLGHRVHQAGRDAGVDLPLDRAQLDALGTWVASSGAPRALVHGDPCLDNWILTADGQPRLIDFQAAGFAPAVLDGAYARAPFPTCWCLARVPDEVVRLFEDAHRHALSTAAADLADRSAYDRELTFACAWWFAAQLRWGLVRAEREDWRRGDEHRGFRLVPFREAILLRATSFVELSRHTGILRTLAEQVAELTAELTARWQPDGVGFYPAFQPPGS